MQLFLKYVGARGLLALIFSAGIIMLLVKEIAVPTEMFALLGLIIGFYFGGSQPVNGALQALQSRKKRTTGRK